jgi:hypothetical protein
LIVQDVKFGYSFAPPLSSITSIPGICMVPMNIMAQNTMKKFGRIMSNDRLMHNQSWKWLSGTSVNSRVIKELLLECRYGYCIRRLVNWAVVARRKYPSQRILASKIDYKSAYRWGILHFCNSTLNSHPASRGQACNPDFASHLAAHPALLNGE